MQMIENGKKGILGLLRTVDELHIIDDQYVHQLVEMDEIVDGIVSAMVDELVDELFGAYIQYHFMLVQALDLISDSLRQMRLAQAHPPIDHQGIKAIGPGLLRHRLAGPAGDPVAITLDKRIKRVYGV